MTARIIAVEVLDREGLPVAGARVWITRAPVTVPDTAALTDGYGRASVTAPVGGRYELMVADDRSTTTVTVDVDGDPLAITVVL